MKPSSCRARSSSSSQYTPLQYRWFTTAFGHKYIYIYIHRERERERENKHMHIYICMYVYIYIYIRDHKGLRVPIVSR